MTQAPIIETRALTKRFGDIVAVDKVSLARVAGFDVGVQPARVRIGYVPRL